MFPTIGAWSCGQVSAEGRLRGRTQHAGVSADLVHLLRTTYTSTWFTTDPSSATAFSTSYGTLPGAPLADWQT